MRPINESDLPTFKNAPKNIYGDTIINRITKLIAEIVPENILSSMMNNELVAVITVSAVIGYMISEESQLYKLSLEIEKIVSRIIEALIKLSPIGIFFLILPPLLETPIEKFASFIGTLQP
jgi:Na+/H+-dicarboxylate symporter